MTNAVSGSISLVTSWNIVKKLGKHDFSRGAVVNNLKDRKLFLIKCIEIVLFQFLQGMTEIVLPCRI